jgi:hypothetical protein
VQREGKALAEHGLRVAPHAVRGTFFHGVQQNARLRVVHMHWDA